MSIYINIYIYIYKHKILCLIISAQASKMMDFLPIIFFSFTNIFIIWYQMKHISYVAYENQVLM